MSPGRIQLASSRSMKSFEETVGVDVEVNIYNLSRSVGGSGRCRWLCYGSRALPTLRRPLTTLHRDQLLKSRWYVPIPERTACLRPSGHRSTLNWRRTGAVYIRLRSNERYPRVYDHSSLSNKWHKWTWAIQLTRTTSVSTERGGQWRIVRGGTRYSSEVGKLTAHN